MQQQHDEQQEVAPYMRTLCPQCYVPVCARCNAGIQAFRGVSVIPMALANDHFYGYVHRFLVEEAVTWLECAAASVCWSTMLVYYLEDPYGHLMTESMEGAQGRTKVRGNLFSFGMAWDDVVRCCEEVQRKCAGTGPAGLPHSEETLASLVRVCIRGGNKDLAQHLDGVTMRVEVVAQLINILRESGYPGYEADGANSRKNVEQRMDERYRSKYTGQAKFVPDAIIQLLDVRKLAGKSIVQDKVATPGEPEQDVRT